MGLRRGSDGPPGDARTRVVMVVRLFEPWVGGMERQALALASELVTRGVDVEILTGRWFRGTPRRQVRDGVTVTRHGTLRVSGKVRGVRTLAGYVYLLTLVAALWRRRRTTSIVHVHGCNYHTFAAVVVSRLTGTPVIVKLANSGEASDLVKMRRGDLLRGSRWMVPGALRADRFVALSPQVREELVAQGVDPGRIVDIPNGVVPSPARRRYDLHDPPRIAFVGRLHPQKGLDVLLDATARVRSRRPDLPVELDVHGEGPSEADLRHDARMLGVSEVVRFHGHSPDVRPVLAATDAFVLPSRAEGLSNALLEALSVGTPAVVTDLPGNRVVVEDGRDALVVEAGSAAQLADAIVRLLTEGRLRERMGRRGREQVMGRFTIGAVADAYEDVYERLLASRRGSGGAAPAATAASDPVTSMEES